MKLQAYNNDAKLKENFLAQIRWHQEQDRIVQGTYGEDGKNFKGCAVGCSIRSLNIVKGKHLKTNDHEAYESELGIPCQLAHLEDRIFEGLDVAKAKQWPLRFAMAITPGADLSMVTPKLMLWLLSDDASASASAYASADTAGTWQITKRNRFSDIADKLIGLLEAAGKES